jgi:hypothetical protein
LSAAAFVPVALQSQGPVDAPGLFDNVAALAAQAGIDVSIVDRGSGAAIMKRHPAPDGRAVVGVQSAAAAARLVRQYGRNVERYTGVGNTSFVVDRHIEPSAA